MELGPTFVCALANEASVASPGLRLAACILTNLVFRTKQSVPHCARDLIFQKKQEKILFVNVKAGV